MAIKYEIVWAKQVSTAVSYTYISIQTGLHFVCVQMMSEHEVRMYVCIGTYICMDSMCVCTVSVYVQYVCMYSMYIHTRTYIHTPRITIKQYVCMYSMFLRTYICMYSMYIHTYCTYTHTLHTYVRTYVHM